MISNSCDNNFAIPQDNDKDLKLKLEDKNPVNEKIKQISENLTKDKGAGNEDCIEKQKFSYGQFAPSSPQQLFGEVDKISGNENSNDLVNISKSDDHFTDTDRSFKEFERLLLQSGYQNFTSFNIEFLSNQDGLFQDLQNNPSLRKLLREWLQYPSVSSRNPQFTFLLKALNAFENCPEKFKIEKYLLSALYLMENGNLHSRSNIDSKSNPQLTKYKGQFYTIVVDKKTGSLVRLQSFLDKGCYKRVKKVLDFSILRIDAVGRQNVNSSSQLQANKDRGSINREIDKMRKCEKVEHVIQLIDGFLYKSAKGIEKALIVTPYCNKGNLKNQLRKLSEIDKYRVVIQISKGILNLHQKKIIHRDLKPENIYLHREIGTDGNEGELKVFIADFGMSCFSEGDPYAITVSGTPTYMPPEKMKFLIDNSRQNSGFESDAWSFGILLSKIFQTPFILKKIGDYTTTQELCIRLINNFSQVSLKPIDESSIDYVIYGLTIFDLSKRMTMQEGHDRLVKIFEAKFPQ